MQSVAASSATRGLCLAANSSSLGLGSCPRLRQNPVRGEPLAQRSTTRRLLAQTLLARPKRSMRIDLDALAHPVELLDKLAPLKLRNHGNSLDSELIASHLAFFVCNGTQGNR